MATIRVKSANLLRRDTAANWSAKNPILREGEEGYETDTGKRKVGDGATEWNNLKYDSGIVDQTYTPDSENAQSGKAVAEATGKYNEQSYLTIKLDSLNFTDGYITKNGAVVSGTSYKYTERIAVQEGDIVKVHRGDNSSINYRFLCAYNNNVAVADLGAENSQEYIVPSGIDEIVITFSASLFTYGNPKVYIERKYTQLVDRHGKRIIKSSGAIIYPNTILEIANGINNKKNDVIDFYANLGTVVPTLHIGCGYNTNYGYWLEITDTTVKLYRQLNGTPSVLLEKTHGLTISKFIHIVIERPEAGIDTGVTITTASGVYKSDFRWSMGYCNGSVFVKSTVYIFDYTLVYSLRDTKHKVFVFGDSYTSIGDTTRYPKYLFENGFNEFLMSGFPGAKSQDEKTAFIELMKISKPQYIVWAMGMNDGDTSTEVNADWKSCFDYVKEYCESNGITPIFCTIPNVPNISHIYKNKIVKTSRCRFIDFADVVGANELGSSWYEGMLSTDNVHPTELGAKALACRFEIDAPEIL